MKRKALARLAAAVMGAVLLVPGAAQPAKAADPNWDSYVDLGVDLLTSFLQKSEGGFDAAELLELNKQLKDALLGVKADLLEHVDALEVAEIRSQVRFTVDNVRMLDLPSTRGLYVVRVAEAAANAREKMTVFSSDGNRDTVARAMMTEYQTLLIGQGRIGMAPAYDQYKEALLHVIVTLQPVCGEFVDPKLGTISYTCGFNGETVAGVERINVGGVREHSYDGGVTWSPGQMSRGFIETEVMEETAQDLARQALFELIKAGH